ncbi:MAG: GntR family transcriptional regulator [Proteobacteria bacterium]|nr:GntR family transcriptional regulator [Pseudomonadota bacterium]
MPAASNPARARKTIEPRIGIREQVYAMLRDRIQLGEITFGDRIVDQELAAELNVSRMPVREALLQLKNEGYLEGTARGFILPQFTPEDIANIFEIRLLLEPSAAASACRNATVEGLGRMKQAVSDAERAHRKADVLAYMQANSAFRAAWVDMLDNRQLAQIIDRLRDHAQAVRLATLKEKEFRALSLQHTKEILDAFLRKDVEAVRESIAHNLRESAASYYAKQETLVRSHAAADIRVPRKRA